MVFSSAASSAIRPRRSCDYLKLADQQGCDLGGQVKDTVFDLAA
jgi:hypothetical protein